MSKLFLISVIAAGCQSRFRNGMQFTDEPKRIEVNDSELAVLESDRHLQVKVISESDDSELDEFDDSELVVPEANFIDAGATNDNAGTDTADGPISSESNVPSEDTLPDDAIVVSTDDSINADELENEPTPQADADTDTAALPEAPASETQSVEVPKAPVDHLDTITEAMRGLNLDVTADKPTVYVLQELGLDVSAKERDAAWNVLIDEHTKAQAESND